MSFSVNTRLLRIILRPTDDFSSDRFFCSGKASFLESLSPLSDLEQHSSFSTPAGLMSEHLIKAHEVLAERPHLTVQFYS